MRFTFLIVTEKELNENEAFKAGELINSKIGYAHLTEVPGLYDIKRYKKRMKILRPKGGSSRVLEDTIKTAAPSYVFPVSPPTGDGSGTTAIGPGFRLPEKRTYMIWPWSISGAEEAEFAAGHLATELGHEVISVAASLQPRWDRQIRRNYTSRSGQSCWDEALKVERKVLEAKADLIKRVRLLISRHGV